MTRLAILSHSERFYSTRRLLEAARALGIDAVTLDPVRCDVRMDAGGAWLTCDGERVTVPDAVLPRIGATLTDWGLALLETLRGAGAFSPVTPHAVRLAADKLDCTVALAAARVPVLPTVAVREPAHVAAALDATDGPPWVLKLRRGTQGRSVWRVDSRASAVSSLEAMIALDHTVLVQPYLGADAPRDLRVVVVGGRVQAACWRVAPAGDFRSNVHRGGRSEVAELSAAVTSVAEAAAEAIGLPVCGVDLIERRDGGFAVLEVNGSPGLEGIEGATGMDLATPIVRFAAGPLAR